MASIRVCALYDRRVHRRLKESYHLHLYCGSLSHFYAYVVGNQESVGYMDKLARFPPYHISDALLSLQPLQYLRENFCHQRWRHYSPPELRKPQLSHAVETQNKTNSFAGGGGRVNLTVNRHLMAILRAIKTTRPSSVRGESRDASTITNKLAKFANYLQFMPLDKLFR